MNADRARAYKRTTPPRQSQPSPDDPPWDIDEDAVTVVKREQSDEAIVRLAARDVEQR